MLIVKIGLYIAIFATTSIMGFVYGGRYSKRVYSLISLQHSIRFLQTEIIIFANPLPYALENISKKMPGEIEKVYLMIKNDLIINQSGDIYYSFIQVTDYLKNSCLLNQEDIDVFLSLGKVIGKTDRMDQEKQFKYVLKELDNLIEVAKEEKTKNEKMYRSLGVLLGLGTIIILI